MTSKMAALFLVLGIALLEHQVMGQGTTDYQVTTIVSPPYVMNKKSGSGFEGILIDVLDEIAKRAKFTYSINTVKDGSYGSPNGPNGTWTGMIGELLRNESHIAVAPMTVMYQRARFVRFSQPFIDAGLRILYKPPRDWVKTEPLFVLLGVFSPGLWVVIILLLALMPALFFVVARFSPFEDTSLGEKKRDPEPSTILNSFLYAFSSYTFQGYSLAPKSISGRILAGFWWLFSLLTVIAFTANLAAYFLTQEPNVTKLPFTSFRELLRQRDVPFGAMAFGATPYILSRSKRPLASRLWMSMKRGRKGMLVKSINEAKTRVRNSNFALIIEGPEAEYMAGQAPCDLLVLGKPLTDRSYAFTCSNSSNVCDIIDHKLLELKEENFILNTKNKWMNRGCNADKGREIIYDDIPVFDTFGMKSPIMKDKAVTLKRFASAFILLFLGVFVAGLILVAEIVYAKKSGYEVNVMSGVRASDQERIQESFDSNK